MPGLYIGSAPVQGLYIGSTPVQKLYRGSTLIWSRSGIGDNFDRDDAATLGSAWADHGPSGTYKAGIVNGECRLALPDGLVSSALLTSHARYNAATAPGDDYELEFRVGSQGSGPSITGDLARTQVFARVSNSGFTHGVGVQLDSSTLRIVRRLLSINTVMFSGGAFGAGDIINMKGVGNLHTLRRNGSRVGEWNDSTGTASKGSGYRSLGVVVMASKDLLGPRRFGPTLDWVELS